MLSVVVTAPELLMPCTCPEAAVDANPLMILLLIFAMPAAPELVMPAKRPLVELAVAMLLPIILLPVIFNVPAAPELAIQVIPPVVAVVAVMLLPETVLPVMLSVPGTDRLEIPVILLVVEVDPANTQFCTVLLFILMVAVASNGVNPWLLIPTIAPVVAAEGLLVTVTVLLLIVVVIVPAGWVTE